MSNTEQATVTAVVADFVPAQEVERLCGCRLTPTRLTQLRFRRKGPPFIKVGRRVFYSPAAVAAWLAAGGDAQPNH